MIIDFTKEELKEVLECLQHCACEFGRNSELCSSIEKIQFALE